MRTMLLVCCILLIRGRAQASATHIEMAEDLLADKIHGGLVGQLLGNLNGLPHENKYIHTPGNVTEYTPSLPEGARTDDDTDIEWVYIAEMQRSGDMFIPPARMVELWSKYINTRIWCANRYARGLMDLGLEPPLTGRIALNPWSDFNISGQFVCEAFGLIAPGMPQSAGRIGTYYTHVAVDGEPIQATQLFTAMIATAFVQDDVGRIIEAGLAAVDPGSEVHRVVTEVRRWHGTHLDDWRATRGAIARKYMRHGGTTRDGNGYELNTAAVVASLLYGRGDLAETMRLAFNFGWDADCNAATAGCIVGVMRGRAWMDRQGWAMADIYRNTTRPGMPADETITRYAERLLHVARRVILSNGGQETITNGQKVYRIRVQSPRNIEPLPQPVDRMEVLRRDLLPGVPRDLVGSPTDWARAAYLALMLGEADELRARRPAEWAAAIEALQAHGNVVANLFKAPTSRGQTLRDRALASGLKAPKGK